MHFVLSQQLFNLRGDCSSGPGKLFGFLLIFCTQKCRKKNKSPKLQVNFLWVVLKYVVSETKYLKKFIWHLRGVIFEQWRRNEMEEESACTLLLNSSFTWIPCTPHTSAVSMGCDCKANPFIRHDWFYYGLVEFSLVNFIFVPQFSTSVKAYENISSWPE